MNLNENGQVGGMEALIFGFLVLVLGTLVVANAWAVIDAKGAVEAAAREAVRTYVQAPTPSHAASVAERAARDTLAAQGRDVSRMSISISGDLVRCTRVVVTVLYRVPLVVVPLLGGVGNGLVVSGRQGELVDPYRAGLTGQAACG